MGRSIETALDVFNFNPVPPEKIDEEFRCAPKVLTSDEQDNCLEELIGSDKIYCFTIKRTSVDGCFRRKEDAFFYGVVTDGLGAFHTGSKVPHLKRWDRFFCPAEIYDFQYESDSGMTVLECYPGNPVDVCEIWIDPKKS